MKLVVLALVIAGCKGDPKAVPPPPASGSAVAGSAAAPASSPPAPDICEVGAGVFEHASCTSPLGMKVLEQAKRALSGTLDIARKASSSDPHQLQILCAQLVQALVRDAKSNGCKVELADADRTQIATLLDGYYAQRTAVVATGDAAADAVIARIAGVRDAMCACTDLACVTRVDKQLDSIGTFAFGAPQLARDLGIKLLDDVSRCESRIDGTRP